MANRSIFDIQSDFCKAMANPIRLELIHCLREKAMVVNEIAAATGHSPNLVSRQLGVLRGVEVVEFERIGTEMLYRLTDQRIGEVCDLVREVLVFQNSRRNSLLENGSE